MYDYEDFMNIGVLSGREKDILNKRYGLDNNPKQTFQKIGEGYGTSRQRIEQIVKRCLSTLRTRGEYAITNQCVVNISKKINLNGGLISCSELLKNDALPRFIELSIDTTNSIYKYNNMYVFCDIPKERIEIIINSAYSILKKIGVPIRKDKLVSKVDTQLKKRKTVINQKAIKTIIESEKSIFVYKKEYFALGDWSFVNPKNLESKIEFILNEGRDPMHFSQITKEVADKFPSSSIIKNYSVSSVHNVLIKSDKFVLIGRGIYALQAFGYRKETIEQTIMRVLKESGEPMKIQDIISEVFKTRMVNEESIKCNLQTSKKIVRVGRRTYFLK